MFLIPLLAFGQAAPTEPATVVAPVTHIDFDKTNVTATSAGPDLDIVQERQPLRISPNLPVRTNFADEMAASVDEVK